MDPLDLLRTEFTVLVVSSADGQNTIDIPSALREQAIIDPVPALSSTALKTRPDYQSIVKELHSHLLLVPLLTIKTADDQKYSRLSNSFNAKGVAEMNIDSSIRCFMSYFFILQKTQPLGERDRTAMLTMVQNGLVPLLMKIVINFLKYDDREWEETTTKVSSSHIYRRLIRSSQSLRVHTNDRLAIPVSNSAGSLLSRPFKE